MRLPLLLLLAFLLCGGPLALSGCAMQPQQPAATQPPSPQAAVPTTGPAGNSQEDQAYQFARGTLQLLEAAAAEAEAVPGVVPPQDVAAIALAETLADRALAQWAAVLDQPPDVQLKAAFFGALGDLLPLVTHATASHAAVAAKLAKH